MKKASLIHRAYHSLFKAKQIMVVDANSRKAARNWSIRPITLWITPLIFIAIGAAFGSYNLSKDPTVKVFPQDIQSQKQIETLRNELSNSEANNDVKQAQILSLEEAIKEQQEAISKSNKRLHVFESILAARKNKGVKILKASVKHITPKKLAFSITLVKGGNYPRHISGHIKFLTQDKHGKTIRLHFENKQTTLPFRMETHIFLQGQLYWTDDTAIPEQLGNINVIVSNLKGKKITQEKCIVEDF